MKIKQVSRSVSVAVASLSLAGLLSTLRVTAKRH